MKALNSGSIDSLEATKQETLDTLVALKSELADRLKTDVRKSENSSLTVKHKCLESLEALEIESTDSLETPTTDSLESPQGGLIQTIDTGKNGTAVRSKKYKIASTDSLDARNTTDSLEALMSQLKENLETLKSITTDSLEALACGSFYSINAIKSGSLDSLDAIPGMTKFRKSGSDDTLEVFQSVSTLLSSKTHTIATRNLGGIKHGSINLNHFSCGPIRTSAYPVTRDSPSTDSLENLIARLRDGLEIFKIGTTDNMEGLKRELTRSLSALKKGSTDGLDALKRELTECLKTLGVESYDSLECLRKELISTLKSASSKTLEALKEELSDSIKGLMAGSSYNFSQLEAKHNGPRTREAVEPLSCAELDRIGSRDILDALHKELVESLKAIRSRSSEVIEGSKRELTDTLRALLDGSADTLESLTSVPLDSSPSLDGPENGIS